MSYIGSTPTTQSFIAGTDYFNGNGSTVNFTLSRSVNSVNDIEVIVNNVEQIPSGYSVSGTTLTFSAAPSAGTSNVYVRYLSTTNLSLAIPAGTSATFNTVTATTVNTTSLTTTNGASIQGLTVGRGAGAVATNTVVGASALNSNTTGSFNIAVGYQAAYSNSTAVGLTAFGANALYATTASDNCAIGTDNPGNYTAALESNTTGRFNTAVATGALGANTTGSNNTGLGHQALTSNTTASNNTAVGYQAGYNNTTGSENTSIGVEAGKGITTGTFNIAVGFRPMDTGVVTGTENTAVGRAGLRNLSTGSYNTALGAQALLSNTTASDSTAVGFQAGYSNTTGGTNVFVGQTAGYNNTTGYTNTFIGYNSGSQVTTGAKNSILGRYNGNQDSLDIRTSSNYIVLSDGDGNPRVYVTSGGELRSPQTYNDTTAQGANLFVGSNGGFGRSTSSLKYKRDVQDATHGLAEVLQLRPVTYKGKGENDGETVFGGLIAEEVHEAGLTEFVQYEADGSPDALAYGNMVSLMVKAIQEQQALITALTTRITALENNNATQ